jgi:hypothetical protein
VHAAIPDSLVHLIGTVLVAVLGGVVRDLRKSRLAFRKSFDAKIDDHEKRIAYIEGHLGL